MWELLKTVSPYVGTFLSGSAVTLYGQSWITFHFKKREELHRKRANLIDSWRTHLLPYFTKNEFGRYKFESSFFDFQDEMAFDTLEPHLSNEIRELLNSWNSVGHRDKLDALRSDLRQEIARIERKWKLV